MSVALRSSGSEDAAGVDAELLDGARVALAWLSDPSTSTAHTTPDHNARAQLLRDALYSQWYIVPRRPKPIEPAPVVPFLESLRAAHAGSWTWEPGWHVEAVSSAGRVVAAQGAIRRMLWPGDYVSLHKLSVVPVAGDEIHTVARYDSASLIDGFWVTYSRDWFAEPGLVLRLYWNLQPSGAAALVRHVTTELGEAAFCLKLPLDPAGFARPDAGVLYLRAGDFDAVRSMVATVHRWIDRWLCDEVPKMSKRLAPGLGAAESAWEACESFGQHRCRLIGEAVLDAVDRGTVAAPDLSSAVVSRFRQESLDPARPWLAPSSTDRYAL